MKAKKIRIATDFSIPPSGMLDKDLKPVGSDVETAQLLAKDWGLELEFVQTTGATRIPNLQTGKADIVVSTLSVTPERQKVIDFSKPYAALVSMIGARKDLAIKDWADLKGKVVTVNKGTPYETLSKKMGEQYGFTVQAYDTQPDATQAVLSGRAYATLGGNTRIVYAASKNTQFIADLELKDTRAHWAAPLRKDSVALRNQMQDVLDCMKKDGTIAKMSEKWFGKKPGPDALERVITPGYGVPGMPGYDPTPHPLKCG